MTVSCLFASLLSIAAVPSQASAASARSCSAVFEATPSLWDRVSSRRGADPKPVQYHDTISYLSERRQMETLGVVRSKFDRDLDSRIYFAATGVPNRNGEIPYVDPEAKAVYVFIHGSGTSQSGGRNFIPTLNTLAAVGLAGLSVDLPFHMEGPISEKYYQTDEFLKWFSKVVAIAKSTGKPVYLVGHSFGPLVIGEYLYRNPHAVDGAVMLSPVGFDEVQRKWYDKYTSKMKFGGDVPENELGGEWSAIVEREFHWMYDAQDPDPTLVNPNLQVRMLTGDREEYAPAPLGGPGRTPIGTNTYSIANSFRKKFRNALIAVEQGIGHYIFNFKDANGDNVVLRELYATVGLKVSDEFELRKAMGRKLEARRETDKLAHKAATDRLFRAWLTENYDAQMDRRLRTQTDDVMAKKILADYDLERKARETAIGMEISRASENMPEFRARFQTQLDAMNASGKPNGSVFSSYLLAVDPQAASDN